MLFNWKLFPGTNLQDLNLDWIINFVKMIPSRLPKFSDHHTWLVYDYSTGEYYDSGEPTGGAGEPGEPGKSPIIGTNGNWWTWNTTTESYVDTGTRAQGVQGEPGAGVASGGVTGDVLVKASGVDYNTGWTATPPQMGAIAHINTGNTADKYYNAGDYLVYNGVLYITTTAIPTGDSLDGKISAVNVGDRLYTAEHRYKAQTVSIGEQIASDSQITAVFNTITERALFLQIIDNTSGRCLVPVNWWNDSSTNYLNVVIRNISTDNRPAGNIRLFYIT